MNTVELVVSARRIDTTFPWRLLRTRYPTLLRCGRLDAAVSAAVGSRLLLWLPPFQLTAAVGAVVLFPAATWVLSALCLVVLVCQAAVNARLVYGLDGSDQMQLVIWGGLAVFTLDPSGLAGQAGIAFVAAQVLLSYLTSGVAKVLGAEWRSGTAVLRILRTDSHGSSWGYSVVKGLGLSTLLSWGTIAFEIPGPVLVLLGDPTITAAVLGVGVLFHLSVASAMGLNKFLWAFLATYPCVWYLSSRLGLLWG